MAAIPSVVIGLGTTGSKILVQVYQGFKKHCEETGENLNIVQFLMLDTQDAVEGAEALAAGDNHMMVGVSDGEGRRQAMWDTDSFFKKWWYPKFKNIGSLFPGAGTVPIKGRLAYWVGMGNVAKGGFEKKFKDKALQTKEHYQGIGDVLNVYLVGTLSGGTGAGSVMEVAQAIRKLSIGDIQIFSISLLPDIVNLLANPDKHLQTAANGYGSLISFNHWLMPKDDRPVELGNFMERGGNIYSGDRPPINVSWLISRVNSSGRALSDYEEYYTMCADAISMMIYEERAADMQNRFNDFVGDLRDPFQHEEISYPKRFGSFAVYSVRYHPEKTIKYLTGIVARKAVDAIFSSPEDRTDQVDPLVEKFMEKHKLREVDDDGDGTALDEVSEKLRDYDHPELVLYSPMRQIINHLRISDQNSPLVITLDKSGVTKGRVQSEFDKFVRKVELGLDGNLKGVKGVNYYEVVAQNRKDKFLNVLNLSAERDPGLKGQITGLHQQVQWLLEENDFGLAIAIRFLEMLLVNIEKHRFSLEFELEGDEKKGVEGNRARFDVYDNMRKTYVASLVKDMFSGIKLFDKKRSNIQKFEDQWWKPWLSTKITIKIKEESIQFYSALEMEVEQLREILRDDLKKSISDIQKKYDESSTRIFGIAAKSNQAKLEEDAIRNGEVIEEHFAEDLRVSTPIIQELIAKEMATVAKTYLNVKKEERTLDLRRQLFADFNNSVISTIETECVNRFGEKAENLSLWDALKIDSRQEDSDLIQQAVERRIQNIAAKCSPYWRLNAYQDSLNITIYTLLEYSYDEEALEDFKAKHRIPDLSIKKPSGGTARHNEVLGVSRSAYEATKHELTIINIEGGAPLDVIEEVNQHQTSFISWRDRSKTPCIVDYRFEKIISQLGTKPWEIKTDPIDEITESTYSLLMAEHFGEFSTPLVRNLRLGGSHKFSDRSLGATREKAFEKLTFGGELYDDYEEELTNIISNYEDKSGKDKWEEHHGVALARINHVLEIIPESPTKELLRNHRKLLISYIKKEYGFSSGIADDYKKKFR